MSRKRVREHSVSPKVRRVAWAEKQTRRGPVLTAKDVTGSTATPVKRKRLAVSHGVKHSQDHTPIADEGIKAAMSLPPIPAPGILASKRDRRGKVCIS